MKTAYIYKNTEGIRKVINAMEFSAKVEIKDGMRIEEIISICNKIIDDIHEKKDDLYKTVWQRQDRAEKVQQSVKMFSKGNIPSKILSLYVNSNNVKIHQHTYDLNLVLNLIKILKKKLEIAKTRVEKELDRGIETDWVAVDEIIAHVRLDVPMFLTEDAKELLRRIRNDIPVDTKTKYSNKVLITKETKELLASVTKNSRGKDNGHYHAFAR